MKEKANAIIKKHSKNSGANWKGNRWTKLKQQRESEQNAANQNSTVVKIAEAKNASSLDIASKINLTQQVASLESEILNESMAGTKRQSLPGRSEAAGVASQAQSS